MKYYSARSWIAMICAVSLFLSGCTAASEESADTASSSSAEEENTTEDENTAEESSESEDEEESTASEETDADTDTGLITPVSSIDVDDQFTERDLDPSWEDRDPVYVTLVNESASADSSAGLTIENEADGASETVITITGEGVYVFSGTLDDGQIVVNCEDDAKVQIVLNGADITNDDGACILVLNADKCFLTMAEDTDNSLSDTGDAYVQPDETDKNVDGVVFADCDLSIGGGGTLTVNAGYDNGIVSKDDLKITGGMLVITSAGKGIEANDSIRVAGGVIFIDAQDDALNTDNDEDSGKGYIYIEDGTLNLASGDDGIHAATALLITGGSITVTESYEGLEADSIDITGGEISVTSSDDGLNASTSSGGGSGMGSGGRSMGGGSMGGMNGGRSENADDASSADRDSSGTGDPGADASGNPDAAPAGLSFDEAAEETDIFFVSTAGEEEPERSSGTENESGRQPGDDEAEGSDFGGQAPGENGESFDPDENASDEDAPSGEDQPEMPSDGGSPGGSEDTGASDESAAEDADGGGDGSASDGSPEGSGSGSTGGFSMSSTDAYIRISGGTLYVNADGDGIDSNGSLYIEGGTIYVDGPVSSGDGAIDYGDGNVEAVISGGTIIAVGSSGMAENFTSATQYEAMVNFSSQISAGSELTVTDADGNLILSYTPSKAYQSVVFSCPELAEGEYTVAAGGESVTITISDYINSSGSAGFGSGSGGMGGGSGGRGGGRHG